MSDPSTIIKLRKGNQMNEKQLKGLMAQIVRANAQKLEAEKKEGK